MHTEQMARVSENRFSRRISLQSIIRIITEEFYTVIISSRAVFWNGRGFTGRVTFGVEEEDNRGNFLDSRIIDHPVRGKRKRGKEEILDCILGGQLVNILGGEVLSLLSSPPYWPRKRLLPGIIRGRSELRPNRGSTPPFAAVRQFHAHPKVLLPDRWIRGYFFGPTFWEISSERKPIFLNGRLRFQRLVSRQETAGRRQIFDGRSIHGSLLASPAFQPPAITVRRNLTFFSFCGGEAERIRNWYPYFLKNLPFFLLYIYVYVYVCVCVCVYTICITYKTSPPCYAIVVVVGKAKE